MRPPKFWNNPPDAPGLASYLCRPLSWIWRWQAARRWSRGARIKVPVPVICVGNINLGGTGKTPTVIALISQLQSMGKTPHILTRGYGGSLAGPVQVVTGQHSANEVGDEPVLLSAFAPTWVSRDRVAGARAAVQAGADVLVMDDGMQNADLEKDLTILVVDAAIGFGNGCVAPAGPLRQPVSEGLSRADLILAIGQKKDRDTLLRQWPVLTRHKVFGGRIEPLETGMEWRGLEVLAFAGIGRPEKFYQTLRSLGAKLRQTRSFDDHQVLSETLIRRLEAEAWEKGLQLVTTEKDAARLPRAYQQSVLTLPVRLVLDDPSGLDAVLGEVL
jgi:tetraacyldisaccharide 4'-kinase